MKFNTLLRNIIFLLLISIVFSCKKDKPDYQNSIYNQLPGNKIIICNEGALGNGNASLSIYNIDFDSMQNNVFQSVNGTTLGDVLNSSLVYNDVVFLAINNSNKIVVVDKNSIQIITEIAVTQPRNMVVDGANNIWVSSLYNHYIYQINATTYQLEDSVYLPYENTEGLLYNNNILYVACWDTASSSIYLVNTVSHQLADSISIGEKAPHSLLLDKDNNMWVFSGNVFYDVKNVITKVQLISKNLTQQLEYDDLNSEMIKPTMNMARDTLYWLGVNYSGLEKNGVFKMSIQSTSLPDNPFIKADAFQYFWGLKVFRDKLYISDPKGFIQTGDLLIYDLSGAFIKRKNAGLGIGNMELMD